MSFSGPFESSSDLMTILRRRAQQQPDQTGYSCWPLENEEEAQLTYRQLDLRARSIAAHLLEHLRAGDRVVLLYPPGLELVCAFFGCLYARVVPSVAAALDMSRLTQSLMHFKSMTQEVHARAVLCPAGILSLVGPQLARVGQLKSLHWIASDTIDPAGSESWVEPTISSSDLTYLQRSTGTTGAPRAYPVTHASLAHSLAQAHEAARCQPEVVGLTWEPLCSQRGLFWGVIYPLWAGYRSVLLSQSSVQQDPRLWLRGVSRFRASISGGPCSAFAACLTLGPEQRHELDLSCWRVAHVGGELLSHQVLKDFAEHFAPAGFRWQSFLPVYGLAEEGPLLAWDGGMDHELPLTTVDPEALAEDRVIEAGPSDRGQTLVGLGRVAAGTQIAVVEPGSTTPAAPDELGEILVSAPEVLRHEGSPSAAQEAHRLVSLPAQGERLFTRTGDLGFLREGALWVLGRLAERMPIAGRHLLASELERTVERSHGRLVPGAGAAFSIEAGGRARVVVVYEVERRIASPDGEPSSQSERRLVDQGLVPANQMFEPVDTEAIMAAVRHAVKEAHGVEVYHVGLAKVGTLPRGPSGTVQRWSCREAFLGGALESIDEWRRPLVPLPPKQEVDLAGLSSRLVPYVASKVASVLGSEGAEAIQPDRPLMELGLTSMLAVLLDVELKDILGTALARQIAMPVTVAFNYPTVEALSGYLAQEMLALREWPAEIIDSEERELQREVETVRPAADPRAKERELLAATLEEPIAIIGMACRLPGDSVDAESCWRVLSGGVHAVGEVPPARWDMTQYFDPNADAPGKIYTRWGGFIDRVDEFDPDFFGITIREAEQMDPQQRLLLEVSWEAFENAGIAPGKLAGSKTGVFVGVATADYQLVLRYAEHPEVITPHTLTGTAVNIASGRISYLLGLQGPSLSVDTACSSSLVTIHLASQSLRTGECSMAIAAGVNLMLSPEMTITLCRMRALAPEARCRVFDSAANGYVRGEGCGALVLKRLSDAQRDHDPILGLVRGSAVNQDGKRTMLTAPNGRAQEAVISQALASARIDARAVQYLEAHGTGTPLGDPIEIAGIEASFGREREIAKRVAVGSIKTNLGHLEAAAGMAGVIKVLLALQREEIPPHLHLKEVSPHVQMDGSHVVVPSAGIPWPRCAERRIAGVSSFGFSGTNAHVVLEEARAEEPPPVSVDRSRHLLCLSGRSSAALASLAENVARQLAEHPEHRLADVCFTANVGRSHFEHRMALVARSTEELRAKLESHGERRHVGGARGEVQGKSEPKIAFLFTGQGAHYPAMARGLYDSQPTFRRALEHCAEVLGHGLEAPLVSVLYGDNEAARLLAQPLYADSATFAVEYALGELWRAWGINPCLVMGHGIGEYVAATLAGVFRLEDAAGLLAERNRVLQASAGDVRAAVVFADEEQVLAQIEQTNDQVSIAAVNGARQQVVVGPPQALREVLERLQRLGVAVQHLSVGPVAHSPLAEAALEAFEKRARSIEYSAPRLPMVTGVSGNLAERRHLTERRHPRGQADAHSNRRSNDRRQQRAEMIRISEPEYWVRQLCRPVQLVSGIRVARDQGVAVFLEVGPSPVLVGIGRASLPEVEACWLPSLCRDRDDWEQLLHSAGELYVRGAPIDWSAFDRDYPRRRVTLSTYPFQRKRYWVDRRKASENPTEGAADWLYEVSWQNAPKGGSAGADRASAPRNYLIFADGLGVGAALADDLRRRGLAASLVLRGPAFAGDTGRGWTINPAQPHDYERLLSEMMARGWSGARGVIHLWSLDAPVLEGSGAHLEGDLEGAVSSTCQSALYLIQAIARGAQGEPPRVWLASQGAHSVGKQGTVAVTQALLWGLGRVLRLEHPELFGGMVDLDPESHVKTAARQLWEAVEQPAGEEQIACRGDQRYVPRLVRKPELWASSPMEIRADATYLLTGGLGGLGLAISRWLVGRGARHLALLELRGATPETAERLRDLEAAGAEVMVVQADVSKGDDLFEALCKIRKAMPPLRGVIHLAGLLADGVLLAQDWPTFARVLPPKVWGAWNLHSLTQKESLDFFVLYSSISSLLGYRGQANYSAANSFLDALTHYRRGLGLPAVTVNWGPWGEVGMAAAAAQQSGRRSEETGVLPLPLAQGLEALARLLDAPSPQVGVLRMDWAKLSDALPGMAEQRLLSFVTRTRPRLEAARAAEPQSELLLRLCAAPVRQRRELMVAQIQELVGKMLRRDSLEPIDPRAPLMEMGLDSLLAVELRSALGRNLGRTLPATLVFDHPSVEAIADYLLKTIFPEKEVEAPREAAASIQAADRGDEPIAIVGLGCRLPGGARNAAELWRVLQDGVDAVRDVPADRWDAEAFYDADPDAPGKTYARRGGFIDGVDQFDPLFFGIPPREATDMDPQQRLVLEVSWEALESAGIAPAKLSGTRAGVFLALYFADYEKMFADLRGINVYTATGFSRSVAAGRLSYLLGLQGPSMVVDTACSSSLVAVHLACHSLRSNECRLALAGGVSLMLSPEVTIWQTKLGILARDGQCKTFDAGADGIVRGEGCGVVVLKRLSDAIVDGDLILALIKGTAVNQDGRSSALTAPNGPAQEAVIREALARGGVDPSRLSYLEAHGTGTSLGDPLEVQALSTLIGDARPEGSRLALGSVKTNLGHLEAAAGISGLLKTVLCLHHQEIPPHLHLQSVNPHIPLEQAPVVIPGVRTPWLAGETPRLAGVSSFGFSGTNAHVVLEEAPPPSSPAEVHAERPQHLLALSAKSTNAVLELTEAYRQHLDGRLVSIADLCHTANTGRSHFPHRLALVASSEDELRARLTLASAAETAVGVASGQLDKTERPRLVFLFTGEGSQYPGMGLDLYQAQPVFRKTLDHAAEVLRPHLEIPLLEVLYREHTTMLEQIEYAHPAMVALECALAELWRSWGVVPSAVLGHGVGELAAAVAAGALGMDDALRIVAKRALMMRALPTDGRMAVVAADEARVRAGLPRTEPISVAAVHGPESTVISGPAAAIEAVLARFADEGIRSRRLAGTRAFQSPWVEPLLPALERAAQEAQCGPAQLLMVSSISGAPTGERPLGPDYWKDHARHTIQLGTAMQSLGRAGYRLFLELGPSPVLLGLGRRCLPEGGGKWLPSLVRDRNDWQPLLESLGSLYAQGVEVDWSAFDESCKCGRIALPSYPFQRKRYWIERLPEAQVAAPPRGTGCSPKHPLLGEHVVSSTLHLFEARWRPDAPSFIRDHLVHDILVVPGVSHLDLALEAARAIRGEQPQELEEVTFHEPVIFQSEDEQRLVQIILTPQGDGHSFEVISRAEAGEPDVWTRHANGRLRALEAGALSAGDTLAEIRARLQERVPIDEFYASLRQAGLKYGASFEGVRELWRGERESLGLISFPDELSAQLDPYRIFPGVLDCCFQTSLVAFPGKAWQNADHPFIPWAVDSLRFLRGAKRLWCHARLGADENDPQRETFTPDLRLFDDEGRLLAEVRGLHQKRARREAIERLTHKDSQDWLYSEKWVPQPRSGAPELGPAEAQGTWVIYADRSGLADGLEAILAKHGGRCLTVIPGESFEQVTESKLRVSPTSPDDAARVLEIARSRAKPLRGLVHLWSVDAPSADQSTLPSLAQEAQRSCASALHLTQALIRAGVDQPPVLWLITRGSQPVSAPSGVTSVSGAELWGLGRTIPLEHAELRCVRVDLDPAAKEASVGELARELCGPTDENELGFRDKSRLVRRLVRWAPEHSARPNEMGSRGETPTGQGFVLEVASRGVLDTLELRPAERQPPGEGEVELRIRTTGLNYKDVIMTLGMYPGEPLPLGLECAGTIVAAGPGVTGFKVGDEVLALPPLTGAFRGYLTLPASLVALKQGLSFEEAASIPVVFLTAQIALHQLAKLKAGDRVLIHAGAGGVGLAAIQLAQAVGAEVFATAGSDEKREFLRSIGVQHVMSSRSLDFAKEVMHQTGGRGVNALLNSLTGDYIPQGLSVLAPGGCFIEIGKIGIWSAQQVAGVRPDVAYHILALDQLIMTHREEIGSLLRQLVDDFQAKRLRPLPLRSFPLPEAVSAFRYMQQARHIGKIVLTQPPNAGEASRPLVSAEATYLITGGLGGLGLLVARWMVERGARRLVLVGRSDPSADAQLKVRELQTRGAEIIVARADIADERQIQRLLLAAERPSAPLRGVIHAAGVLEDGVLLEQDWTRFARALHPKVEGGWNLHSLTLSRPLDFFVLFSSQASLLGASGQCNYASANAFLDALAHYRRARGRPALSINWGPWAEVGMAAGLGEREEKRWASMGQALIPPEKGLEALERLLSTDARQVGVMRLDWAKMIRSIPNGSRLPVYSELVRDRSTGAAAPAAPESTEVLRQLEQTAPAARRKLLTAHLQELVMRVTGLDSPSAVDPKGRLMDMGIDSLLAVELRNILRLELGRPLPVTLIFDYPSVETMVTFLLRQVLQLETGEEQAAAASAAAPAQDLDRSLNGLEDAIEDLSEEELEKLLAE